MRNKIIAFSNSFVLNAIKSFFERYDLVVDTKLEDEGIIEYVVQDKQGNVLTENLSPSVQRKSYISIQFEKNINVVTVQSFYPCLNTQPDHKKGDSTSAFYVVLAHFIKHFNLHNDSSPNLSGRLFCYDGVYSKFYKKMRDLNFIEIPMPSTEFSTKQYKFALPSFFIDTSQVKSKETERIVNPFLKLLLSYQQKIRLHLSSYL